MAILSDGGQAGRVLPGTTISIIRRDHWWVATHEETGVVSQAKDRQAALENLQEALAGYHGADPPGERYRRGEGRGDDTPPR